jgi:hypothetical protein
MRIVRELDAGPVADVERSAIGPLDTAAEVEAKLSLAAIPLVARTFPRLARGELAFGSRTCKGELLPEARKGRWRPRFFGAGPGARRAGQRPSSLALGLRRYRRLAGEARPCRQRGGGESAGVPGTVMGSDEHGLLVAAGSGCLRVRRLQRPGGRMLGAPEFLRGHPVPAGTLIPSHPMARAPGRFALQALRAADTCRLFSRGLVARSHPDAWQVPFSPTDAGLRRLFSSVVAPRALAQAEIADLREDVRGLSQRVNDLSLRVEQLEHENSQLKAKAARLEGTRMPSPPPS